MVEWRAGNCTMGLDADLTTVGAICGIAASVWLVMRDVAPLAARVAPRVIRLAKIKYANSRAAVAQRDAKRAERVQLAERRVVFKAFEASVSQLRLMEQQTKKYHATEWIRQIETCKRNTLQVLRRVGVNMGEGSVRLGPWIGRFETGSIIVDWGPSRWNLGRVQVVIFWHPSRTLTYDDFHNSYFPDGTIEHVKVLSKALTDADMEVAGWKYFDGWHTDYGLDGKWLPVGRPDHQADR